jgi:hypothetical protein
MKGINPASSFLLFFAIIVFSVAILPGCVIVQKYQKNVPFVFKNNINLKAENTSKDEKVLLKSRLKSQLTDSARPVVKDKFFIFHYYVHPPVFDTNAVATSAANMRALLINSGFYSPSIQYSFDTVSWRRFMKFRILLWLSRNKYQKRVTIKYDVNAGKRTLIDTVAYLFTDPQLQQLAVSTKEESQLQPGTPVSRTGIVNETNRLVNLFKNNGYYKFTADEIRATGDTSIAALTSVSEDPFEQLRLLAEAQEKRDKPTIRLGFQLNNLPDSSNLQKYFINQIYVLPDYLTGDLYTDSLLHKRVFKSYTAEYHRKLFRFSLIRRNLSIKKDSVFRQDDYFKTINDLYKLGVWESPNIDILEQKDTNLLNLIVKLVPLKRYSFEGNIEMSYSANNATSSISTSATGNLLGLSANLVVTDRNLARSAIRMTNGIKAGVEFNTSHRNSNGTFINSNELSYSNTLLFPKFIFPFGQYNNKNIITTQSFINTNISLINRIDFFNQQVFNTSYGFNWTTNEKHLWSLKLFNFDYRRLYNRSKSFDSTLLENPFLRYSFNTALVMGGGLSYNLVKANPRNPKLVTNLKVNLEESGLLWDL